MSRLLKRFVLLAMLGAGVAGGLRVLRQRKLSAAEPTPPSWPPFDAAAAGTGPAATATDATAATDIPATEAAVDSTVDSTVGDATDSDAAASIQPLIGSTVTPTTDWVLPENGECPAGYPIKANDDSGIYHVPGGRSYDRTIAERCYATAEAAERDGYRPSKA